MTSTELAGVSAGTDTLAPILTFPVGMLGFPNDREYTLERTDDACTMFRLCSTNPGGPRFLAVAPAVYFADYAPEIPDEAVATLGLTDAEDAVLVSLVSVPKGDPQSATVNLFAPVVINHRTRVGAQVILGDQNAYPLRRRLVS
ncbi:MAG: flagellar assembly protein FliW [Propionicimonas sp.]